MGGSKPRDVLLDANLAAFLQGEVSVIVSTRDADHVPDVARGCGCRVSRDRRRVTVLFDAARAGDTVANVAANGQVAVVFSQPSTHRTIQLKGTDAKVMRVTPRDRAVAERHLQDWSADMLSGGYTLEFSRAVHGDRWQDLAAVVFTPVAAFQQTPGPAAGEPLGA